MVRTTEISNDFILNKAVQDATNILLKQYMTMGLSEPHDSVNTSGVRYGLTDFIMQHMQTLRPKDFLTKMAVIAWDFLNVLSIFQNNFRKLNRHNTVNEGS